MNLDLNEFLKIIGNLENGFYEMRIWELNLFDFWELMGILEYFILGMPCVTQTQMCYIDL